MFKGQRNKASRRDGRISDSKDPYARENFIKITSRDVAVAKNVPGAAAARVARKIATMVGVNMLAIVSVKGTRKLLQSILGIICNYLTGARGRGAVVTVLVVIDLQLCA
jgi:hypothetical protein